MSNSLFTILDDKKTLEVKRTFNAPKSAVWSAYSEAEKLEKWWGPNGWSTIVKEMNFNVGGHWLYCMTCNDKSQGDWFGQSACGKGVFEAIDAENSFTYTDYFTDEDGNITPGMPASKSTVSFSEEDGKTTITSISFFENEEALKQVMEMGMEQGFDQTWDKLDNFVVN